MLVLSRKVGESLVIADNIKLTIVKISGNRVRLGIEAPEDVSILRGEIPRFCETPIESITIDIPFDVVLPR
jgi:carbon storage regulator